MILLIYSLKQNYYPWFENEKRGDKKESIDKEESADLNDMPPLEGDEEEVKKKKRIKIFNSKQIINQTYHIISKNISWKQFRQIKK